MSIKKLEELVGAHLQNGHKIISYEAKNLLPPGENYGSTMLGIDIKIKDEKNKEETIQCVAKATPPSEVLWEFFNTKVTFKKEIGFYNTIVPTLNSFAEEKGANNFISFVAKCLGARISLNPKSEEVDADAAFVLENLKVQGYVLEDRFIGVDIDTSKLILDALAAQHAASIALKLARPEEFEAKVRPYLDKGLIYDAPDSMLGVLIENVKKFTERDPKCSGLSSRLEKSLQRMKYLFLNPKVNEPLATIQHLDLWTNNLMVKFQGDKAVSVKLVDYQLFVYGSPMRDVIFFLYTSARLDYIEDKMDELIRYYYDKLIEMFTILDCPLSKSLTFEDLMQEAAEMAIDSEFTHIIFMLTPIFTLKGQLKEHQDWNPDKLAPDASKLHENYYKRLHFIVRDFVRRNWI